MCYSAYSPAMRSIWMPQLPIGSATGPIFLDISPVRPTRDHTPAARFKEDKGP
jgi:hypothetical protein